MFFFTTTLMVVYACREAADRRYLADENQKRRYHSVIGMYFANVSDASIDRSSRLIASQPLTYSGVSVWGNPKANDINFRRVVEASYHLSEADDVYFDKAVDELCNFDTIWLTIIAGELIKCIY